MFVSDKEKGGINSSSTAITIAYECSMTWWCSVYMCAAENIGTDTENTHGTSHSSSRRARTISCRFSACTSRICRKRRALPTPALFSRTTSTLKSKAVVRGKCSSCPWPLGPRRRLEILCEVVASLEKDEQNHSGSTSQGAFGPRCKDDRSPGTSVNLID